MGTNPYARLFTPPAPQTTNRVTIHFFCSSPIVFLQSSVIWRRALTRLCALCCDTRFTRTPHTGNHPLRHRLSDNQASFLVRLQPTPSPVNKRPVQFGRILLSSILKRGPLSWTKEEAPKARLRSTCHLAPRQTFASFRKHHKTSFRRPAKYSGPRGHRAVTLLNLAASGNVDQRLWIWGTVWKFVSPGGDFRETIVLTELTPTPSSSKPSSRVRRSPSGLLATPKPPPPCSAAIQVTTPGHLSANAEGYQTWRDPP